MNRRVWCGGVAAMLAAGIGPCRAARPTEGSRFAAAVRRAAGFDQLHGLAVAWRGEVVVAEAMRGPALDRPVNVKSVSKTLVASLAGAAIDRGVLEDVDQPLGALVPGLIPASADPRVREITVAQLLTMQAGLERTSGPNYGRWVNSDNWVEFVLSRPLVTEPGAGMLYSTGSYHLLGAVLTRVAGKSLLALAREWLGAPLGIAFGAWTRDPQGYYLGGNNMVLSPLDLLRFGEMWRAGGTWGAEAVLSKHWVAASWTPRTFSPFSGDAYGYGWFLTMLGGQAAAYARGYGGQMLYVVPSRELTVVVTSDPTRPARSEGYVGDLHALMVEEILPAVR